MNNILIRLFGFRAILIQGDILFVERVAWLKQRLRPGSQHTLDAGCGVGGLAMLATRHGNDVIGLTFSQRDSELAVKRAQLVGAKSARFEVVDLRVLDDHLERLGQNSYDQIIACEVIEHLKDDELLIKNLATLLKPDGQLLLTTPFEHHHPVYGEKVSLEEDGGHVRFGYTHERLRAIFHAAGLKVDEEGYLNGFVAQRLFSWYLRLHRLHPKVGWLLTLPFRPLRILDGMIHTLTRYPYMTVTIVGKKEAAKGTN